MKQENEEKKEDKVIEYECTNCPWNGTELSKSCRTLGHFVMEKVIVDGKETEAEVHKPIEDGSKKCPNSNYLDHKCPVCGDEVGKPGIREKIRKEKEAKEKAERAEIDAGLKGGAIY
jgi:predicted RNA-binding Zn-ribbon protein involved in translation (DUF1610 family)